MGQRGDGRVRGKNEGEGGRKGIRIGNEGGRGGAIPDAMIGWLNR